MTAAQGALIDLDEAPPQTPACTSGTQVAGAVRAKQRRTHMRHGIRFTLERIGADLGRLFPLAYRRRVALAPFRHRKLSGPLEHPPVTPDANDRTWGTIPWGSYWGEPFADFVLRTRFRVPAEWDSYMATALHLPIGESGDFSHPEALAYIDGAPFASIDRHHQEILLKPHHLQGPAHSLALHGWTGVLANDPDAKLLMRECALVQIDGTTREFVALARVALGIAAALDVDEPSRAHLLNALAESFQFLDLRDPLGERFYTSVPRALDTLRKGIALAGPPMNVDITATGHAHLDVAWLWPLGQTRRKAGRTFHNVLRLMEQFPDFHFAQSQPQLYEFVRQDYPALFEGIQQRVREGLWEPLGGTWVEPDANLTGGESLVRQFLLGRRFFEDHFGQQAESPVLWLPDVFGFPWSLPQLIKEAGLHYFFTIKLGWNQYNRLPYDSFWWQGINGDRILTHFGTTPTAGSTYVSTFNAQVLPEQVLGTWRNLQQKECGPPGTVPPLLMSFGWGDGGGGPTREMLENIRELGNFPATPKLRCGKVGLFFRDLEERVGDRLPTWNGELYLENHRGTYTTQSRSKRANRQCEFLLHDAEFLASAASIVAAEYSYPHDDLHRAWRLLCLNQFHDILPGSSIGQVYVKSLEQYKEIRHIGQTVRDRALEMIGSQSSADILVVNPSSFARQDLVWWPDSDREMPMFRRGDGAPVLAQQAASGWWLDAGELPPYSITPLFVTPSGTDAMPAESARQGDLTQAVHATSTLLENGFLRVELDEKGDIVRIYDRKNDREVLPRGVVANQLQAFEDRPINPDAWDIDIFYDDKVWLADPASSVRVVENGPLRATLEVRRGILDSTCLQRISLAHSSPQLDFDTEIDWCERHILLKVAFPVSVLSPRATYEIQFGNIERPTHRNTSWDWARFEVPAHKWVDLSEGGYGVSLLNDCKYGHDVWGNVMRLSLLRGPTIPDPDADKGTHRFTYSLLPHANRWGEATIARAYALNDPLIVWPRRRDAASGARPTKLGPASRLREQLSASSYVAVNRPNVVVETIKQAEDGQGLIVRLYESQGCRGRFTLRTSFPLTAAWRANLLEMNQDQLTVSDSGLDLHIDPYQIVSLRLLPQAVTAGNQSRRHGESTVNTEPLRLSRLEHGL